MDVKWKYRISGMAAGLANGLFGGGGGMVLVPALTVWCGVPQKKALAGSTAIILPLCVVSFGVYLLRLPFDWALAWPYLLGGLLGGFVGGRLFAHIDNTWLRRIFGAFLLYGAVRYLW